MRRRSAGTWLAVAVAGLALAAVPRPVVASTLDDWSAFRHDPLHSGVSPDTTIGATYSPSLTVKWSQPVGGGLVYGSPVVVYNATLNQTLVYDVSASGVAHAFDAVTGASVWTSAQPVGIAVLGSPAVDGNTLYIGSQGILTALDATTGALQCAYHLPIFTPETHAGHIDDGPVIGHDSTGPVVYFGDAGQGESRNHGHEWAINGYGNTAGNCTVRWTHDLATKSTARYNGSWSPPALGADSTGRQLVVFGSSQPDDAVYALDASTGNVVWRFQTSPNTPDADVGAAPALGAPGINGFGNGVVYVDGKDRILYAIDLLTGGQVWAFDMLADSKVKALCISSPTLVGNLVVVAYAKYVYALDATTGAKVWQSAALSGNIEGSVAVSGAPGDQVVLIGDLTGREYALRLSDGVLLATVTLSSTQLQASTAVSAGMAFTAGIDGNLYAMG